MVEYINGLNLWTFCGFLFWFLTTIISRILSTDRNPATYWLHHILVFFYHCNLPGYCLRAVIQPLVETTGLLISWVFSFLPQTIPTSTDQQGGDLLPDHPHGHNHLYSHFTDRSWFLTTYPRVRIFTYSPRTGTSSKCLQNPWGVTLTMEPNHHRLLQDAVGFSFLPRQTNKYSRVLHTRPGGFNFFPDHDIKGLLFPNQKRLVHFPKKHTPRQKMSPAHRQVATWTPHTLAEN